ncbi:MAG: hypothetical protein H0U74_18450 [Bradymonadaceae bacterium]|nr:hypothetical protein [Lujinxingiaceae bacterium]
MTDNRAKGAIEKAEENLKDAAKTIAEGVSDVADKALKKGKDTYEVLSEKAGDLADDAKKGVKKAGHAIDDAFTSGARKAEDASTATKRAVEDLTKKLKD